MRAPCCTVCMLHFFSIVEMDAKETNDVIIASLKAGELLT